MDDPTDAARKPALEDLVAAYAERRERGERLDPASFAAEHPEAGDALRRALDEFEQTTALFPEFGSDIPDRVGPYRVLGEMGRGGMGRILRAEHAQRPGEPVALKLLHAALEGQERALERFRREGEVLLRLRHPGVVRVIETGLVGARPYIAMELVEGTSLAERLREARGARGGGGALASSGGGGGNANAAGAGAGAASGAGAGASDTEARGDGDTVSDGGGSTGATTAHLTLPGAEDDGVRGIARLMGRVARAVAAAHREGVLHRDLNPRNILVRADGQPVVIDFGLGRSDDAATLTATGDMLGTPQYMAPEQARGERVDERNDVWGLGATLYELLTLAPPRAADETLSLLRVASALPVPGPRRRNAAIPRDLDTIVRRAMSYRRAWRYAGADALAADLERFVDGEPVAARPPGLLERGHDFWLAHHKGVAAAGVMLLVAVLAFVLLDRESPESLGQRTGQWADRAVATWLDGDLAASREATAELADVNPDFPLLEFFRALGDGELLAASDHAAVAALIDGHRALQAGDPDAALRDFEAAWSLLPDTPFIMLSIGQAAWAAGKLPLAERAYELVARHFGAALTLHRTLSQIYAALDKPDDAAKAAEIGLRLAPDDARLWETLARARLRGDDLTGAHEAASQLARHAPDDSWREPLALDFEDRAGAEAAAAIRALDGSAPAAP